MSQILTIILVFPNVKILISKKIQMVTHIYIGLLQTSNKIVANIFA